MLPAYHQIALPEHLQDHLRFVTPWSTFKYNKMVFGLKTAASHFQVLMNAVNEECNVDGLFAYKNDLLWQVIHLQKPCKN